MPTGTMQGPSAPEPSPSRPKKLKTFDEDDIVRYSLALDVPIVGLVRNREEYKEMREMALITGTVMGLTGVPRAAKRPADAADAESA